MSTDSTAQTRHLDGSSDYEEALDTLFAKPGTVLRIFDRALGTGYNSPHRYDLLRGFLLGKRSARIQIAVHDASNFVRNCPRMVNLVREFSHAVEVRETLAEAKGVYDPFSVIDELHYVHRFHYDQPRGLLALDDPQEAHGFVQRFAEIWDASAAAVVATTLGL